MGDSETEGHSMSEKNMMRNVKLMQNKTPNIITYKVTETESEHFLFLLIVELHKEIKLNFDYVQIHRFCNKFS